MSSTGNSRTTKTKQRIIDSGVELFSRQWYEAVSVAEICRHCGMSNGVFYRYFPNKEALFREIVEGFLDLDEKRLTDIPGDSAYERLNYFYSLILKSNNQDSAYISVYREGEYRYPEYGRRLRDIYLHAVKTIFSRPVSEAEYLYLVGSPRFIICRLFFREQAVTAQELMEIVRQGPFKDPGEWSPACLDVTPPPEPDAGRNADTRTRLLLAGKELIATQGYHTVNVYEVARKAGYAVGTFYIHFESKEDFFVEVVRFLNRGLRSYIAKNLDPALSRFEQELQGYLLFLRYFQDQIHNYQIVREAEFVVKEAAREYYDKFESGYIRNLKDLKIDNPVLVGNFLIGIAHHLGIECYFSKNIDDPAGTIKEIGRLLYQGMEIDAP